MAVVTRRRPAWLLVVLLVGAAIGLGAWAVIPHQTQAKIQSFAAPVPTVPAASARPSVTAQPTVQPSPTLTPAATKPVWKCPATSGQQFRYELFIPDIGVSTCTNGAPTLRAYDSFLGKTVDQFPVPTGKDAAYTTTWWSSGPVPGSSGMAVITGHHEIGGYGVFNHLDEVQNGAPVLLESPDGSVLQFIVTKVQPGISKSDPNALDSALQNPPPGTSLALITCSGTVDTGKDSHQDNTVVFAKEVTTG